MEYDVESLYDRRANSIWDRVSIGDIFERLAVSDPERVILISARDANEEGVENKYTAKECRDLTNKAANSFKSLGLKKGDIVTLLCENSIEAIVSKIALASIGVTAAPINPSLNTAVMIPLVNRLSPKLLVCDSQFIDKAEEVSSGCGVDIAFSININGDSKNRTSFKGFTSNSSVNPVCENIHGDDIWEILFTSGSSSLPKGVMVSHIKTYFEALSFSNITPLKLSQPSQITVCSYLPIIYHVGFCMLLAGILSGGKTVIGRGLNFRSLAETIERERVTTLWAGSPQALELTATEYAALNGGKNVLKNAIFGWGAMSPKVYREIKKSFGDEFSGIAIIGQTESCCAHRFFIDEHPEIFETECPQENYIGLPSPLLGAAIEYVEGVSVTNESGEVQNGEAVYRSPAMMAGYYKDPEATKEALSGGWFHSGDNFGLMSKGQRTMIDRIKDVIKTGGENVSSIRVEGIINQFSSVSRSAVIGVPHKKWGEAVIALVILKEGVEYDELSLISHLKKKLSSFEVPKWIILEQSFPESVGGKVQKYKLREKYKNIFQQ